MLSFGAESLVFRCLSKNLRLRYTEILFCLLFFYGCETWALTLRKKLRLRVFENRVLRRMYEPKRNELIREWRKLHTEELYDFYSSPDIIRVIKWRRMRWAGHVASMGQR